MMSFESSADNDEKTEKKKKKKGEAGSRVFERSAEDKKPEKNERPDDDDKPEKEPDDSKEASEDLKDDELSTEEAKEAVEQYVEARAEDLKEDLENAQPDSVEEAVALADAALIEAIQEQEVADEAALDAVLAETIEELGLESEEIASDDEQEVEVVNDLNDNEEADPLAATTATSTSTPTSSPTQPTPPVPPTPPIPPTPPVPPTPAPGGHPPSPTPSPGPHFGNPPFGPPSPNTMPTPGTGAASVDVWRPNRRRAGDMLLGGIVGYLIGRRRGRIKTEARLLPIQEKLEKDVKSLHDAVAERETKIRQLAAEKVMAQPEAARPVIIEKLESRMERKRAQEAERERPIEKSAASELPKRPETIGRFIMPRAEVAPQIRPETLTKSTETMTMPELLAVADRIERDGISVKEMYDAGRLDAVGLRRVVNEYLKGERLDKVLTENLRLPETYERYIEPSIDTPATAAGAGTTLNTTSKGTPEIPDQYAAPQPRTPLPPENTPYTPQRKQGLSQNKVAIVTGAGAAIIILILLVLFA